MKKKKKKSSIENELANLKNKFNERYNTTWMSRREFIEQNQANLIGR